MDASAPASDDAFIATVGQHYPGLVRRLTAVLDDREAALDIAQESYLRAFRAWERFDEKTAGWCFDRLPDGPTWLDGLRETSLGE